MAARIELQRVPFRPRCRSPTRAGNRVLPGRYRRGPMGRILEASEVMEPEFDATAFMAELDRMGMKLSALQLADGTFKVYRWACAARESTRRKSRISGMLRSAGIKRALMFSPSTSFAPNRPPEQGPATSPARRRAKAEPPDTLIRRTPAIIAASRRSADCRADDQEHPSPLLGRGTAQRCPVVVGQRRTGGRS
jgi:hypothetical protein